MKGDLGEEIFDLVDRADRVVGKASRRSVHKNKLLHRAVHIFIRSGPDRWILQKRSSQKDEEPLLWTTSCSGHVDSGETYLAAAVRETKEELGLTLEPSELIEVFRSSACRETANEFVRVYACPCKDDLSPDPLEVLATRELTLAEIEDEMKGSPDAFCNSFRHLFPYARKRMKSYISSI